MVQILQIGPTAERFGGSLDGVQWVGIEHLMFKSLCPHSNVIEDRAARVSSPPLVVMEVATSLKMRLLAVIGMWVSMVS